MSITEQTTISEIAGALPSSVRVFQRHGIDFCCGGKRPIGAVCAEKGLSFPVLAQEIQSSVADSGEADRDRSQEPLADLIAHIVTRYHDRLRDELPVLETLAAKVARVHGGKAPHLARVETIVTELSADLHSHMQKEEVVLFPTIAAIEAKVRPAMPISAPIAVMEHEHDHAGQLLAELRRITRGYDLPDWACTTFRALYGGLAAVEADMHVHVHLENNILFPRALALVATT
jgi:regulator of cell morphogenesis and NO signaling